jgi:mRNA interferase RelE/StbE
MKVDFKKSFLKELKKLKNNSLQNAIYQSILQVESAENISQVHNLKKLNGSTITIGFGLVNIELA